VAVFGFGIAAWKICVAMFTGATVPLLQRFRALGEVHPVVFRAYGEISAGMEVLTGQLADKGR
jgi:hypothetical protein